jgi:hypothetical protein
MFSFSGFPVGNIILLPAAMWFCKQNHRGDVGIAPYKHIFKQQFIVPLCKDSMKKAAAFGDSFSC